MNDLKHAKKEYDSIEIPSELDGIVKESIHKADQKKKVVDISRRRKKVLQWVASIAAVFVATSIIGLNTSEVFAQEVQKIPVLGSIAKVFTVRSYKEQDGDKKLTVVIPNVKIDGKDSNEMSIDVNAEIEKKCNLYLEEAKERADEYKKAFFETGGTEEEWKKHDIQIKVGYEIKTQTSDCISFVVKETESWTSAYGDCVYYNLDLKNNQYLSLEDVLGSDYIEVANESIRKQIKQRQEQDDNNVFFSFDEEGFQTIDENTNFYMNENGNPVIVFDKYEIAPGGMGRPEFEIERS